MSQEELVHAYVEGSISRRTFIRRLVATGVTLSAAIAYTHALRPAPAGADQSRALYEAPAVITTQASDFTGDSARLNADVDPNGLPTTVYFEFGTTTAYGVRTPNQEIPGGQDGFQQVGAAIVGLDPGRTYHYRAVAANPTGQAVGGDVTLVIPDSSQPVAGISQVDEDIDAVVKSGVLRVLVSSDEAAQLVLEASMKAKKKGGKRGAGSLRAKRILAARGSLTLDDGGDRVAELKLTRAGKRALKKASRAKLTLQTEATDLAGNSSVSRNSLRLS